MAVTNFISSYRNVGDGVSKRFVFPFRVLEEAHIGVVLTAPDGVVRDGILVAGGTFTWGVETPNAFRVLAGFESGDSFTLEFGIAPAAGVEVLAFRRMPMAQPATFNSTDLWNPKALETALDRIVMMVQQLQDGLPSGIYVDPSLGTLPYGMVYDTTVRAVADVRPQSVDGDSLIFGAGRQAIDGYTLQFGEMVLCCAQASPTQNGPWQVMTVGTETTEAVWTRPFYFHATVRNGLLFLIRQGVNFKNNVLGVYSTSRLDSTILVGATQLSVIEVFRQVTPTVAVGTTESVPSNEVARVVNRGTTRDMVLDFYVPEGKAGADLYGGPFTVRRYAAPEGAGLMVQVNYGQISGLGRAPKGMSVFVEYVIPINSSCFVYVAMEWDTVAMVLKSYDDAVQIVQSPTPLKNTATVQYELVASVLVLNGSVAFINNMFTVPVPDPCLLQWAS